MGRKHKSLVWCIVVLVLTSRHLHSKSSFCRFTHGCAHGLFPFYLFQHHFREFEAVACIRQQILVDFGQAPVDRTAHAPVSDSLNLKAYDFSDCTCWGRVLEFKHLLRWCLERQCLTVKNRRIKSYSSKSRRPVGTVSGHTQPEISCCLQPSWHVFFSWPPLADFS